MENSINNYKPNLVLGRAPPKVNKEEEGLSRKTKSTLFLTALKLQQIFKFLQQSIGSNYTRCMYHLLPIPSRYCPLVCLPKQAHQPNLWKSAARTSTMCNCSGTGIRPSGWHHLSYNNNHNYIVYLNLHFMELILQGQFIQTWLRQVRGGRELETTKLGTFK